MYALHNHLKITRPKIAHRDTPRVLKHRELWTGDGETNHAPLRFADLQQNRGYGGRREGGSERFTRRRGLRWALREVLTARFVSTGYENPLLHPRPPGPSRSKEAFSPRPCSPGNALTHTHRTPSHRSHPHLRGEAVTAHPSLPPPTPGVRVRARPCGSPRGGGWSSPASPAGLSARGSGPWRRRRQRRDAEGLEGAGSPQAAPGEQGLAHLHTLTHTIFLLLALPPPTEHGGKRGRPKLGLFRPVSWMQRRPPHRLIPSSSSSSPGRARRTAVTGAVARGPAGDTVTNRRGGGGNGGGGNGSARALPAPPSPATCTHRPARSPLSAPRRHGRTRGSGEMKGPERPPALRTAGCGDPPARV